MDEQECYEWANIFAAPWESLVKAMSQRAKAMGWLQKEIDAALVWFKDDQEHCRWLFIRDPSMKRQDSSECCPPFEPDPWDDKEITWEMKPFLQARVLNFLHIPLNFGAVMKRSMATIDAAGAAPDEMIVLSDENSLWGANVYIAISKDIPGARTAALSGTFLAKVFEGPYRNIQDRVPLHAMSGPYTVYHHRRVPI